MTLTTAFQLPVMVCPAGRVKVTVQPLRTDPLVLATVLGCIT